MDTKQAYFNFYERRWRFRDFYFRKVLSRHIFEKYFHTFPVMPLYAGKMVLSINKTNRWIYEHILSQEPFMVARFGNTELQTTISVLKRRIQGDTEESRQLYQKWFERISLYSGFFPLEDEKVGQFADVILDSCAQTDLLAMWHCNMEDYVIKNYMSDTELTFLTRIEPWNARNPWTKALEGKRVLVIHPFEDSIQNQYKKRKLLFENPDVLPEFELRTLKAVQTIAGNRDERFADWFEALDYMYREALKIDFDVAIIGCGAYGMPLATLLKKEKKQVVHLGGVTQLLFGIKGKRWLENPCYRIKVNEHWIYPAESETPAGIARVENGCYWR